MTSSMMTLGRVYVDFDDVLCETARTLAGVVKRRFGKEVPFERIHSFDLKRSFNLTDEETAYLVALFHDDGLLGSVDPVPGALEGLKTWSDAGWRVWIVTGRPPDTYHVSKQWLERRGVAFERLLMVDKYARRHKPIPGIPIMTLDEVYQTDFALAVEDSPDMAALLLERSKIPVALLDRPWNAASINGSETDMTRLTRYKDWAQLAKCLG